METVRLGKTGLMVTRTAFGALPIQRLDMATSVRLLHQARDGGINFFDTARMYSDSEEKIGVAFGNDDAVIIATKSHAKDRDGVLEHIETSLGNLRRECIDLLQLHNPIPLPDGDDEASALAGVREAVRQGKVRHIGITSHARAVAEEAVVSGDYATLQFPLSAISSEADLALVDLCRKQDVGFIAMKALCGGLLSEARAPFAFLRQYRNVVPIWGIQHEAELEEFSALEAAPPELDEELQAWIDEARTELAGDFCRACGYCLPCPAEIPIPMAARMRELLKRMPTANYLNEDWREKMTRIEACTECGACRERCPYKLDTPRILRDQLAIYNEAWDAASSNPSP